MKPSINQLLQVKQEEGVREEICRQAGEIQVGSFLWKKKSQHFLHLSINKLKVSRTGAVIDHAWQKNLLRSAPV